MSSDVYRKYMIFNAIYRQLNASMHYIDVFDTLSFYTPKVLHSVVYPWDVDTTFRSLPLYVDTGQSFYIRITYKNALTEDPGWLIVQARAVEYITDTQNSYRLEFVFNPLDTENFYSSRNETSIPDGTFVEVSCVASKEFFYSQEYPEYEATS